MQQFRSNGGVFFDENSTWLFDWGRTSVQVSLEIGESLEFSGSLDIAGAGLIGFCLGVDVRW